MTGKVEPAHLRRAAYVYVRQSTLAQVERNTESLERQYELVDRAVTLGWDAGDGVVVDRDLGRSAKSADGREGFERLVADVGLGKVGVVLGIEVSRLARRNSDWYRLLDLCALTDTLIADADGVCHPGLHNDRLLLGLKGAMSGGDARVHDMSEHTDGRFYDSGHCPPPLDIYRNVPVRLSPATFRTEGRPGMQQPAPRTEDPSRKERRRNYGPGPRTTTLLRPSSFAW